MPHSYIQSHLEQIRQQVHDAESRYNRAPGSVQIIAVSKTRSAEEIRDAATWQQCHFGESYAQEAIDKISQLGDLRLTWHFIGPIQKNKTKSIAQHFDWVHSLDRAIIAERLNVQRPEHMTPINVCVQININQEDTKSGVSPAELPALASQINDLPNLRLRGLMAIPAREQNFDQQRATFDRMRNQLDSLNKHGFNLDTLSMGMSNDFEAAIASGATMVRIGTAIFGPRKQKEVPT